MATNVAKADALTNVGFKHMLTKDYAGGKPYFDRALDADPNFAMAHLNLGAVYQNTGMPTEAREQFNLAIANDTKLNNYPLVTETTDGSEGTITQIANRNLLLLQ